MTRTPTTRTRGDLCPGVFRPWPAEDGALVRLRVPGGALAIDSLTGLLAVAEEYGEGRVHLTSRANLQLRGLPGRQELPPRVVEAIRSTGLLPHPGHELVRNIMASPLTGLAGGRADLRPVTRRLDELLVAHPSLARLPGRFLFVLDDGRGDLVDRRLDLGLVAVSASQAQLRLGSEHWGPLVPLTEAADALVGLARAFVSVRGTGPQAPWHVDELPATPQGRPRDERTLLSAGPTPYGPVPGTRLTHRHVPDGLLDRGLLDSLPASGTVVVTPWHGLVVESL